MKQQYVRPRWSAVVQDPFQGLAYGFGSGLAPFMPGTFGTLAAVPLYLGLAQLSGIAYAAVVAVAAVVGCWLCGYAARALKVHDHPAIVWDEFVGFWITMWLVPPTFINIVIGFVLFRILDMWKPWPIRWFDRHIHGGIGIMLDDIIAGALACALTHGILSMGWV